MRLDILPSVTYSREKNGEISIMLGIWLRITEAGILPV